MVSQFKIIRENKKRKKRKKKRLHTKPPPRSHIIFTITNPTATHTRSHCKPPSSPIIMLSLRLHKADPICGFVGSTRSMGFVCHQYERERERVWQNEGERWTNFLNFCLFFCFFFHFLFIINFLYNIYDMARSRSKQWWCGQVIDCLVGT